MKKIVKPMLGMIAASLMFSNAQNGYCAEKDVIVTKKDVIAFFHPIIKASRGNQAAFDLKYTGKRFSVNIKESDVSVVKAGRDWQLAILAVDKFRFSGVEKEFRTPYCLHFFFPPDAINKIALLQEDGNKVIRLEGMFTKLVDNNTDHRGVWRIHFTNCSIKIE